MATPSTPSTSTKRALEEHELETIVGGIKTPATTKQLSQLIHEDLVAHSSGEDAAVAAEIVSGAATAKEVIGLIESGATKDGEHSADQQLTDVQSALIRDKDTTDANAFGNEEANRLLSGTAQAQLGQLSNSGAIVFDKAQALISQEAQASGLVALGAKTLSEEKTTGGNTALEKELGELMGANAVSATAAIHTVEAAAKASGRSVDSALVNLGAGEGGQRFASSAADSIASAEYDRLASGQSAAALAAMVADNKMSATNAAEIIAEEGTQAALAGEGMDAISALFSLEAATGGNAAVEAQLGAQLKGGLLDGSTAQTLASAIPDGSQLTQTEMLNILNEAVKLAQQKNSGVTTLAGAAEGEVALAQFDGALQTDAAAGYGDAADFDTFLQSNFGAAIAEGNTITPILAVLGPQLAANALSAGQQLAAIANPETGAEATIIANLEQQTQSAGGSIDAALTLAAVTASGQSEVLKIAMTDRLMSGQAESDIASLVNQGTLSPQQGVNVLSMEVGALCAGSVNNGALGFDRPTAVAFVLAKLDLAAVAIQNNGQSVDAAQLQTYVESNGAPQVAVGLGAVLGLLSSDPADNATQILTAQGLLNIVMPAALAQGLVSLQMAGGNGAGSISQLTSETQTVGQAVADAFSSARQLVDLESSLANEGADGQSTVNQNILQSLASYGFVETGVTVGASESATFNVGDGMSVTFAADANASASVSVGLQTTIQAAAEASASETLTINSHTQVVELAQAIADGSVVAGVTGVAISGNAATSVTATVTNTQSGSLGVSGLQGMETTTYQEQLIATASANASFGEDNQATVNLFAGGSISVGETGSISYHGVSVGGGVTVYSPGVIGDDTSADANFSGGNLTLSFTEKFGVEEFGLALNLNVTLPTASVVNALQSIGVTAGQAVASEVQTIANSVASGVTSAVNQAEAQAQAAAQAVENAATSVVDDIGSIY